MNKYVIIGGLALAAAIGSYTAITQKEAPINTNNSQSDAKTLVSAPQQGVDLTNPSPIKDISTQLGEIVEDLSNEQEPELVDGSDESPMGMQENRHPIQMPENVPEQARLALEMGYIEREQSDEFYREREQLNMLEETRQELESADVVE